MGKKRNHHVLSLLFMMVVAVMLIPMISSCGKDSAASPTGLNTQLNIINIGPDRFPVYFYIAYQRQSKTPYIYGVPSGYFYVTSLAVPVELRLQTNAIVYSKPDSLKTNCKYSVFLTGLVSDNTDTSIFVTDTATAPALGRGKVRFINGAARTVNVDVVANGTSAFKNVGFLKVSNFLEVPAGIYDFRIYNTGTTSELARLQNVTIQDGRLYTLYSKGVVGRTDSAIFSAAIITNK